MNCSLVDVFDRSVPRVEFHTDERLGAQQRPMFVVGISCTKPKTRAFVTERSWAYQTNPAFSDSGYIRL
ncbi:hypothetical protein EB232_15120 [Mesorhizobium sp. NZP2077]|nr:hypothetical protein EB232_15120 [Mesorhizobium sp. NZP2077]